MTEIRTIITPVRVEKACGACAAGRMAATGGSLLSNPPRYLHVCDRCGRGETYNVCYPYIDYVEGGAHEPD